MELPSPNACYLLLVFFIPRLWLVCECHDEDFFPASTLAQQLQDLRMANFPRLQSYSEDNRVPHGLCKTWLGTVVEEKSTWKEERCRRCACDPVLGRVCTQPQCEIDFHPYLHANCEEWSSDGCCCLRTSCVYEGVRYAVNDWFPLTSSDPCTLCKCDPSDGLPQCLETVCPPLDCVDATSLPGQCCPVCVSGSNCGLPPFATLKKNTVDEASPIAEATSRVVTLVNDADMTWNCTCREAGNDAECVFTGSSSIT